jgi:hypothetical protein
MDSFKYMTMIKAHACHVNSKQARSQTMNTVGAPASSCVAAYIYTYTYIGGVYVRTFVYVYNALLHNALYIQHCTKYLAYTYTFENELFPTTAVQQGPHVDAEGVARF